MLNIFIFDPILTYCKNINRPIKIFKEKFSEYLEDGEEVFKLRFPRFCAPRT